MYRYQPYHQYDVQAIEEWLNEIAEQGWKLVEFGAFICKFKPDEGERRYYRVRYIPGNREISGTFFWGDLYVYYAKDPSELPHANYDEDSVLAAREYGRPSVLMAFGLCMLSQIVDWFSNFGYLAVGEYLLFAAGALGVIIWILLFLEEMNRWRRANRIAEGEFIPSQQPPNPYAKLLGHIIVIPAFLILIFAAVANT